MVYRRLIVAVGFESHELEGGFFPLIDCIVWEAELISKHGPETKTLKKENGETHLHALPVREAKKMAASQQQASATSSTASVSGPGSAGGSGPQQQPQPPAQLGTCPERAFCSNSNRTSILCGAIRCLSAAEGESTGDGLGDLALCHRG